MLRRRLRDLPLTRLTTILCVAVLLVCAEGRTQDGDGENPGEGASKPAVAAKDSHAPAAPKAPAPADAAPETRERGRQGEGVATPTEKSTEPKPSAPLSIDSMGPRGVSVGGLMDATAPPAGEAEKGENSEAPAEDTTGPEKPSDETPAASPEAERPSVTRQADDVLTSSTPSVRSRRGDQVIEDIRAIAGERSAPGVRRPAADAGRMMLLRQRVSLWTSDVRVAVAQAGQQRAELQTDTRKLQLTRRKLPWNVRKRRVSLTYARNAQASLEKKQQEYDRLYDTLAAATADSESRVNAYRSALKDAESAGVPDDILKSLRDCAKQAEQMQETLEQSSALTVLNSQLIGQVLDNLNPALDAALGGAVLRRSDARITAATFTALVQDVGHLLAWCRAIFLGTAPADNEYALWSATAAERTIGETIGILLAAVILLASGRRVRVFVLGRVADRAADEAEDESATAAVVWRSTRLLDVLRAVLTFLFLLVAIRSLPFSPSWTATFTGIALAWCGYRAVRPLLRLILSPREPQFRAFECDAAAARRVFRTSHFVLLWSAVVLPILGALAAFDYPRADVLFLLKLLYGAGAVALLLWLINEQDGPLGVIAPRESELGLKLHRAGRIAYPVVSFVAVALLVTAALGYTNLSSYLAVGIVLSAVAVGVVWPLHQRSRDELHERFPVSRPDPTSEDGVSVHPGHAALRYAERILALAVLAGLLILVWRIRGYHFHSAMTFASMPLVPIKEVKVSILGLLEGVAVVWLTGAVARVVRGRIERSAALSERWDRGARYGVGAALYYTIFIIGILVAILVAGMKLSVLTAFAGMLGVAVGFGSQDIAKNTICGLIILLDPSINVGDFVDVAGQSGSITDISIRSTTIRTNDNRLVVVPNSTFYGQNVVISSQRDRRVRLLVDVAVAGDSDLDRVTALLTEAAVADPCILAEPEPEVIFAKLASAALNLQLVAWTDRIDQVPQVQGRLMATVWRALQQAQITMA